MTNPEKLQSDIQKRREELQKRDPALTPEFWEGVERDAENHWLERGGLTLEEYKMLVYSDTRTTN